MALTAQPSTDIIDMIIDQALHHVEDQQVLRDLLAGKSWSEAFGTGGKLGPNGLWEGNSKGIHFRGALITPKRIMERVRQYGKRPKVTEQLVFL